MFSHRFRRRQFDERGLRAQSLAAHPGLSNTNPQTHTVEEGGGGWMAPFFERMAAVTEGLAGALARLAAV